MRNIFFSLLLCIVICFIQTLASNLSSTPILSLLDRINANLNPVPSRILEKINAPDSEECDLYISTSTVPNSGRGIFAGKDYQKNSVLSLASSLPIPTIFQFTQLSWYVFNSSPRYSSFIFGPACLFNTMPTNYYNVDQIQESISIRYSFFDDKEEINKNEVDERHFYPYSISNNKLFVANTDVKKGQELFVNYGDNWLENHGIKFDKSLLEELFPLKGWSDYELEYNNTVNSLPQTTQQEVQYKQNLLQNFQSYSSKNLPGICISNIMVEKSTLPLAGQGVYALKDFKKGDLITISPVLLLNLKHARSLFFNSIVMNYVLAIPNKSDYGLFFTHYTSTINHSKSPNVVMKWFDWDEYEKKFNTKIKDLKNNFLNTNKLTIKEILLLNPSKLLNTPLSNFDIGFYAEKNIKKGEELFINYGSEWEKQYNFYLENNPDCIEDIIRDPFGRLSEYSNCYRQFVHPIEPPKDLFPLHWYRHDI